MTADAPERLLLRVARWCPTFAVVIALVVWAAVRSLHLLNADALLPALISTQELTFFYWGQDRLGSVVPLLAAPISDVRWNLAAQNLVLGVGWFGLIALAAANHLAGTCRRVSPVVLAAATAAAGGLSMVLLPTASLHVFAFEQQYAIALLLHVIGLFAVTRRGVRWWVVGATLVVAGSMINPSLVLYVPVIVVLPGVAVRSAPAVRALGVAVGALVLTTLASALFGDETGANTGYNEFSPRRSWHNLDDALAGVWDSVRGWPVVLAALLVGAVLVNARHVVGRRLAITYLGAPVFALGWTVLFSGNHWVATNNLYPRYFFPMFAAGLLLITASVTELVRTSAERWTRPPARGLPAAALVVAVVVTVATPVLGVWALTRVDIDALDAAEPGVVAAREHDVDLVTGDYWGVWPTVIAARADGLDVLGLAYRATSTGQAINDRIARGLAHEGNVTLLCIGVTAADCAGALANWGLSEFTVVSEQPLVVDVTG